MHPYCYPRIKWALTNQAASIHWWTNHNGKGVPDFVVDELRRHLVAYVPHDVDAPLFLRSEGGVPRRRNWSRIWSRARTAAGVSDRVHLHDLRHMGATLAAQSGGTTKELMACLGHSTPKAALIYQHAVEERD
jgi:integrase